MSRREQPAGPLSEEQILKSVEYSGFPLEIRLLQAFHDGNFDPTPGQRFVFGVGDKERSAEVDLTARAMETLPGSRGLLLLTMFVEAKRMSERVAFVGFKWKQPSLHEMRSIRTRLSGLPSCGVLSNGVDGVRVQQVLLGGDSPPMAALDVLNQAPVCPQWCVVRDSAKRERPEALKDDDLRDSFRRLVHATTWVERDSAQFFVKRSAGSGQWRVEIKFPTVVISTRQLYAYDPLSQALETTDHLILREMYEVGGEVHERYVDVVTEHSVGDVMARYREAARGLNEACGRNASELQTIVEEQLDSQRRLDAAENMAELANLRWRP